MQHYTSHYLAEILRDLYFEESSGRLQIQEHQGKQVDLHFDRGMLYFADGNNEEDRLAARLAASGILPAGEIAALSRSASDPLDLAARVVAGPAGPQAGSVLRSLVEGGVRRAFSWPSGVYEFSPGEPRPHVFQSDVLFTFECLLKGICGMAHFGPLKEVLLRLPGRLRMREAVFLPVHRLALKPHHGYLISRVDASMRLDEIALLIPPGEEDESLLFLYGLAVLGIVELVPPVNKGPFSLREIMQGHYDGAAREDREVKLLKETAARIAKQSPVEVLGVSPESDLGQVHRAYEDLKKRFRKGRFSERIREKHKREIDFIENKLAEAFLTLQVGRLEQAGSVPRADQPKLVDPGSLQVRREMVKTKAQAEQEQNDRLAEKYYQKAREYLQEKDYHNCIQFCRLAIKFNESLSAAHALMGDALMRNPNSRWQKLAEEALARACELDPWNAEHHVALGQFYASQGLAIRARREFEKALEIVPGHAAAKGAIKQLGRAGS